MKSFVLFLLSMCLICGCYVSQESIQTEDVSQEEWDRFYEISKSHAKPLPPEFPNELWPDIEHGYRMSYTQDGEITVSSMTKHTVERVHNILENHFLELGWKALAPDEETLEYMDSMPEEDWGVEGGKWKYWKEDKTIKLWAYSSHGHQTSFDITYSNAAMRQGHADAMQAKLDAFGETNAEAEALLESVKERYLSCSSYRDKGDSISYEDLARTEVFDKAKFVTAYERVTGNFRHEHLDVDFHVTRNIFHRDVSTMTSSHMGRTEESDSLGNLFSSPVSTPQTILPLLFANEEGIEETRILENSFVHALKRVQFLEDEKLDVYLCKRVQGINKRGIMHSFWIDAEHMIRKIEVVDPESEYTPVEVYTFSPEMNIELNDKDLEFQEEGLIRAPKEFQNPLKRLMN